MAQITVDRDSSYAPCSYLICKVENGQWSTRDDSRTVLIQMDWDYPAVASAFGFVPCDCGYTDGTVDCNHKTASEMIAEAAEYLDDHIGEIVDDPGYFA